MSGEKTEYVTCSTCDGYGKITSEQQEIENLQTQIQIDAAINYANIQTENAALKEAIIELIPMAEQARDNLPVNAHPAVAMLMNKRIERAKKLLNKQTQSESDGDKNLS